METFKNTYFKIIFMKINVLNEDSNSISFEIEGEGHTLCNLLRQEMWTLGVSSCGYNLKHPIISSPMLNVEVSKGNPKKIISLSIDEIRKEIKFLRTEFKKLK